MTKAAIPNREEIKLYFELKIKLNVSAIYCWKRSCPCSVHLGLAVGRCFQLLYNGVVITGYYILYYHTITPGLLLRLGSQVYQYAEPTRQKIPAIHQPDLVTSNHPKKSQKSQSHKTWCSTEKYIYYILELPFKWVVRTIERIWCKAILQLSPFKLNKNPAETEKVVQTFILLEVVMQWIVQQLHELHPAQVTLECQKLQLPCMQT